MREIDLIKQAKRRNVFEQSAGHENPRDVGSTVDLLVAMPLTEQHRDSILKLSKKQVDARDHPDHMMFVCDNDWNHFIISNYSFEREYLIRKAELGILFVVRK